MLQKIEPLLCNVEFVFVQIWRMNIVNDFVYQKKFKRLKKKNSKLKKKNSRLNLRSRPIKQYGLNATSPNKEIPLKGSTWKS
jgi:hypothetical protein